MERKIRQYVGLIVAVIIYYVVHEGAHMLVALFYGVFKQINFMGLGIQVDVYHTQMTDTQMGIFCLAGALSTLVFGWLLVGLCNWLCSLESKVLRTIAWYTSIIMLLLDPIYLSILCGFFGGGDMNGIALLFPEIGVRIVAAIIGVLHLIVLIKYLLPRYTKSFQESREKSA